MVSTEGKMDLSIRDIDQSLVNEIDNMATKDKRSRNAEILILLAEAVGRRKVSK